MGRVARRSLLRDRWRAVLIVVLIGLPVFGIATAALLLETALPTPAERAIRAMGRADLQVQPIGQFGRTELSALVPVGSTLEPIWQAGDRVVLAGSRPGVSVSFLDSDGLAAGMLTLIDGRVPAASDEVALSAALASLSGTGIGGTLHLEEQGSVRVVGRVEDPRNLSRLAVLGQATLAEAPDLVPEWLVVLPPGVSADTIASDIASAVDPAFADTGQPMFDVVTRAQASEASETFVTLVVMLGSLALVESALVAAAAFAVGIRRRQRELGLLGAVGASPRQLAASVLAEGLVAGIAAVVAGIGLGILVAWLISLRLDDLTGQRAGSLELEPVVLVLAGFVGLAAAVIASSIPAWGAARLPTLVALSGRRPPSTPARRLLALGVVLIVFALGCSLAAPLTGSTGQAVPLLLLVIGAVTGVLGFGACSPWLLERLEGPARRLSLAPRVALRDTARARTRNGPIVTAVLASVAATIALASVLASEQAHSMTYWRPQVSSDSMTVFAASEAAGARVAQDLGAVGAGPERWAIDPDGGGYAVVMPLLHPDEEDDMPETSMDIVVGDAALLTAYHGEAGVDALAAGDVVVLQAAMQPVTGSRATVVRYDGSGGSRTLGTIGVSVVLLRDDWATPDEYMGSRAVMTPATAQSLGAGVDPGGAQYLVRLDHDVTQADMERAARIATSVDAGAYVSGPLPPSDPMLPFRLLVLGAALIAALTVTGIAVALGEVEARPDQRTLLALGAPGGLRRRITASRGFVIAALAGLLAVPAGLLPVWGVLLSLGWPVVIPVPEIVGALVILPLAAVLGGLLLGRPIPEWSARRDATG